MTPTREGSFRLFRFAGIDVYLHWSWFVIALIQMQRPINKYSSFSWNILEYLALFGIVLLHEFGHALACRQVGGKADQIVLWPLGGVAYVQPPPRPGATLWSIAAGPLVNVILLPIIAVIWLLAKKLGWNISAPDAYKFISALGLINFVLLAFNLLPIYPLDGGQILQSLLWFVFGRARSLMIAAVVGLIGAIGLVALAFFDQSIWLGIMAFFIVLNCWRGWGVARALARFEKLPRHKEFRCPHCQASPPAAPLWKCGRCGNPFDTFQTHGTCPNCGEVFGVTACFSCGRSTPIDQWGVAPPPLPSEPPPVRPPPIG